MRRDLVQQQYRIRLGFRTRKSRGLGQNQVQNQGFLLAGGTFGGRAVLVAVHDDEIAAVRAGEGAAGGGVAARALPPGPRQAGLDLGLAGARRRPSARTRR